MLNIRVGAARDLDYLHTGTSVQFRVIHRDVKSSNIFLNENLEAKISTLGYRELVLRISHALLLMFILIRPALDFTLDEQQHRMAGWANQCNREASLWTAHREELILLGKLSHPNLVKLFEYCWEDYTAKLLDFVLAKLGPHNEESHVTTRVAGTYDFMDAKYIATDHIYIKSDVYAFAMVMLEIITALRAMVTKRYGQEQNLLDWGRPFLYGKKSLQKIMDPRLVGEYPTKAASKIAELILICLRIDPKQRPFMDEVVSELQVINEIKMKPRLSKAKTRQSSDWHQQNHCWSPFGTNQETKAWSASASSWLSGVRVLFCSKPDRTWTETKQKEPKK
uniref:Probable serine/threonine-protein kinase PIX13 n=1 Tax=Tanacetum cinerariifolium TaxID=118510 RepID=A0A6L2KWI1_TANCI|nr:probable serine/threonine-protein kinase PIX13 [Tanacetum cinerariifolium]